MTVLFIIFLGIFLAYANGANDNFKGVATLFGSGTTSYKKALTWATLTTFLGSVTALVLAQELLLTFKGKGLVPDTVVGLQSFSLSVTLAAACTVMLATKLGFPISTTHALTGALVGVGSLASPMGVNFSKLGSAFFLPLIVSPILAMICTVCLYPLFRFARTKLRIEKETCLCVGNEVILTLPQGTPISQALAYSVSLPTVSVGTNATCQERYSGNAFGISTHSGLDFFHFLSAGAVSFARGLNDTPKITALLLAGSAFSPKLTFILVALAMAVGGILNARKVAETMSHKVTSMNTGQGFTANFVTAIVVIFASRLGMPVSTTHVSCGSLFGIGVATQQAKLKTIASILVAWLTTLPLSAGLGILSFLAIKRLGV